MKQKKLMLLCLALTLTACLLIGCSLFGNKTESDSSNSRTDQTQPNSGNADPVSPADGGSVYVDPIVQENEAVAGIIQSADNLLNQGYYAQAYRTLNDAIAKYGARQDLTSSLSNCERLYVQDALNRAENKFNESKDYEGAIDILMLAQVDLPDSVELQNALDQYRLYRPIELKDITVLYEEGYPIQYHDWETFDNCGNRYSHRYVSGGKGKTVYLLNGKYDVIKGVVFIWENSKNYNNGSLEIYGNDRLLYSSGELKPGTMPIDFEVSVTGIVQLELRMIGGDGHDWTVETPMLANVTLSKNP